MLRLALVFSLLFTLCLSSSAQNCSTYTSFSNNLSFSSCNDLPYLNSFLYWNYNSSSGCLEIAYRHTGVTTTNWVAWAINPNDLQTAMIGAQALVAFQLSNGSMRAYTSQISSYTTNLPEGNLQYSVSDLKATYANGEIVIYATLSLPINTTNINQVWQDGQVSNGSPEPHSGANSNINSKGTLKLLSGKSAASSGGSSIARNRNIHGVLCAIGWGILMPFGIIIARYMKVFKSADPAWFYLHVTCQTSAYIIGLAGWAVGLNVGSQTPGVQYTGHKTIGILLFILGTLQSCLPMAMVFCPYGVLRAIFVFLGISSLRSSSLVFHCCRQNSPV
ncbi:hypothetical protein ACB092_05G216600 [Castanea dentata]